MAQEQESIAARIEAEKQAMVRAFNAGDTAGAIQHQAAFYSLIRWWDGPVVNQGGLDEEPCSWCGARP